MLISSTTGIGIAISSYQKRKYDICNELIRLCDCLLIDLEYKVTPINILIDKCLEDSRFLTFVSKDNVIKKKVVQSCLKSNENELISTFLYELGKSNVSSQIKLIKGFKKEFENVKDKYFEQYNRYKKIDLTFGVFIGATICLVIL